MNKFLLFLLLVSSLFSLKVGDIIDEVFLEKLGVSKEIVVIDFFASWCVGCKQELPLIDKLAKSRQDIQFIGIDSDEDKNEGLRFQKSLNLSFGVRNDNDQKIISKFNPIGIPAVYIIQNGIIKKTYFGVLKDIDKAISKDLKELKSNVQDTDVMP